ncbi:MAG: DNA polymerase [Candidatus Micrarchaeaceae archaeon]
MSIRNIEHYALDIETYTQNNIIYYGLGVVLNIYSGETKIFYEKQEMIDWLTKYKKRRNVYIHNGFNFDMLLLFNYNIIPFNPIISKSKIYSMVINNTNIYDSYMLMPKSLKELGENINMIKGNLQEKLAIMNKSEFEKNKNEITEYCIQDCKILSELMKLFFEFEKTNFNINHVYKTAGSYSFHNFQNKNKVVFKQQFSKNQFSKNRKRIMINPYSLLFKLSYYGGRTEAIYFGGVNNIYYHDFNSLYPYVMSNADKLYYPDKYLGYIDFSKEKALTKESLIFNSILEKYEGIAFVNIQADSGLFGFRDENNNFVDIGLLPLREKTKAIYPIGNFSGYYNFNELRYAINHGYKISPKIVYVFSRRNLPLFSTYVNELYQKRKTDPKFSFLYKLMLNSLYGKFGELRQNEKYVLIKNNEKIDNIENKQIMYDINDNPFAYLEKSDLLEMTDHTDFSIASYITSYARIFLLKKVEDIIMLNGKIYYMDTDSIFSNIKLEDSKELGNMKVELFFKNVEIRGLKDYEGEDENNKPIRKVKGLPKTGILIKNSDNIRIYKYNYIVKYKEAYNKRLTQFQSEELEKVYTINTDKRGLKLNTNFYNAKVYDSIQNPINLKTLKDLYDYLKIKYPFEDNNNYLFHKFVVELKSPLLEKCVE